MKNQKPFVTIMSIFYGAEALSGITLRTCGIQSILVSTDLSLEHSTIIHLYSYRFKIECTFQEIETTTEYYGYFYSVTIAVTIVIPERCVAVRHTSGRKMMESVII